MRRHLVLFVRAPALGIGKRRLARDIGDVAAVRFERLMIALLLRRRIGRLLIVVGSAVALMIFAGLFVAGAELPPIVYGIPALPLASVVLACLPATGRWTR